MGLACENEWRNVGWAGDGGGVEDDDVPHVVAQVKKSCQTRCFRQHREVRFWYNDEEKAA